MPVILCCCGCNASKCPAGDVKSVEYIISGYSDSMFPGAGGPSYSTVTTSVPSGFAYEVWRGQVYFVGGDPAFDFSGDRCGLIWSSFGHDQRTAFAGESSTNTVSANAYRATAYLARGGLAYDYVTTDWRCDWFYTIAVGSALYVYRKQGGATPAGHYLPFSYSSGPSFPSGWPSSFDLVSTTADVLTTGTIAVDPASVIVDANAHSVSLDVDTTQSCAFRIAAAVDVNFGLGEGNASPITGESWINFYRSGGRIFYDAINAAPGEDTATMATTPNTGRVRNTTGFQVESNDTGIDRTAVLTLSLICGEAIVATTTVTVVQSHLHPCTLPTSSDLPGTLTLNVSGVTGCTVIANGNVTLTKSGITYAGADWTGSYSGGRWWFEITDGEDEDGNPIIVWDGSVEADTYTCLPISGALAPGGDGTCGDDVEVTLS